MTIGKTAVDYHPSFRLYLSSSLPLFMPGEGQVPLPFSKTCTISMSVSREGICDALLADTLRLERPEFDGQLRSVDRDVGLHRQQINNAKVWWYISFLIHFFFVNFRLIMRFTHEPLAQIWRVTSSHALILISWLIDWLIDWLTDWLIDLKVNSPNWWPYISLLASPENLVLYPNNIP